MVCSKIFLIVDKREESLRRTSGRKYDPTWYYQPETDKLIHWSKRVFCDNNEN